MANIQYHVLPEGRRIAFSHARGRGPTLVFLPGYMSDMAGSKAGALLEWAQSQGRACLLLDYSGCGRSDGDFSCGTLSRWRDDTSQLIAAEVTGPIVLVGSSMGGWLMLLLTALLGDRVVGLIGVAAAPDFTDWGFTADDKARLAAGEAVFETNPYGPEPTPTYPGFWADGDAHRLLDHAIDIVCPIRLIHGQHDSDVPWQISLRLAEALRSADIQVTLIKDGDHRLSRPADIALLLRVTGELLRAIEGSPL